MLKVRCGGDNLLIEGMSPPFSKIFKILTPKLSFRIDPIKDCIK